MAERAADLALGASQKGISVDANAGKAEAEGDQSVSQNAATAVTGQVNETTQQTLEGPVGQVVNESGLEFYELMLIVLLAGWAIPSPKEMALGFCYTIRDMFLVFRPWSRGRRSDRRR